MSGFLWKATVRDVNRALKEINAFEWEGDYRNGSRIRHVLTELGDLMGAAKVQKKIILCVCGMIWEREKERIDFLFYAKSLT